MKWTPAQVLQGGAMAALALAWVVAAHAGSAGWGNPDVNAAVALAPLVGALLLALWRQCRWWWVALALAALGVALAATWSQWRQNVAALYYLQHLGAHLALAALFGRTLRVPQVPLVTRLAQSIHPEPLSPRHARYTRRVTWAWTLFFAANALVSTGLFWWASAEVWSFHANLMTGPLVALVFAGELLCRRWVLPAHERPSLASVVRAYRAHAEATKSPADPPVAR